MATVLDRPTVKSLAGEPSVRPSRTERLTGIGLAQWLVAALLAGAGAVHLALAPSHFGESTAEGVGFVIAAWLQLVLAVAALVRPSRLVARAVIAVSFACIAVWVVSRTFGLPFGAHAGHAETVTVVDGVTVAMEAATIVIAATFLLSRTVRRFRSSVLAFGAIVGVFALTSAVLASPDARDHSAAAHGETGGHEHAGAAALAGGGAVPSDLNGHHIKGVKAHDVAAEEKPDVPLDPETRGVLASQLTAARDAAMQYPTVADAEAAGYHLVGGGFGPGAGAHYIGFRGGGLGTFDPARPPTLIYSGINPTSRVVGLMYLGMGDSGTAPEGFAGPNDHWHRHSGVCLKGAEVIFPVDASVTEAQCSAKGGQYMNTTTWMVHAWVVPAWESSAGVFSHENPNLRCADGTFDTDKIGRCEGT